MSLHLNTYIPPPFWKMQVVIFSIASGQICVGSVESESIFVQIVWKTLKYVRKTYNYLWRTKIVPVDLLLKSLK